VNILLLSVSLLPHITAYRKYIIITDSILLIAGFILILYIW